MSSPPKAKIYTRTGDKGKTRLVDGSCVEKFNPRVEAYGTVDELNSALGVVRLFSESSPLQAELDRIQNELFDVGSWLACPEGEARKWLPPLDGIRVDQLEKSIDHMSAELPELKEFILPGGGSAASHLHVARTICRRAERRVAEIEAKDEGTAHCLVYLNRLSDWLFVAARWINARSGHKDIPWKKQR
ncbi:MAG: cob(I)yrinic acid a,c-diamide adenosyltransferase [Bdellovibrionaceae bacterium]|nr:cob(I)yrinic acid a,c-diamide adenosyltransferase [Pseudobdellovibrionaceae bacterium]